MLIVPPPAVARATLQRNVTKSACTPARKILLTGFEAFDKDPVNPSWLLAQSLHGKQIAGHRVSAALLPTAFDACAESLRALVLAQRPALVVCLGLAGGREALSLERVAININDARIPDNLRIQPVDTPVVAHGPAAYFSALPLKTMLHAMRAAGAAVEVSNSAGTFVCNHLFYALMHMLATDDRLAGICGGFVHVPWFPEQARSHKSTAAMPLHTMQRGLRAGLRAALRHGSAPDIRLAAGTTH